MNMKNNTPLPDFSASRILVVGDIILDEYCYGKAERVSPEAPVQVVSVESETKRLGGGANVAANIAALGVQVTLIGLVGDDQSATVIADLLDRQHIEHCLIRVPDSPTIIKRRILSHNQQLLRLDYEDGFPKIPLAELTAAFNDHLNNSDSVLLSDYAKGCLRHVEEFIVAARKAGKTIFIDPKRTDFSAYTGATILTPNWKEFSAVVGTSETEQELEQKASDLREACDLHALLITRGNKGMSLFEKDKQAIHFPAEVHEVYDTTGAGDTVISVLASAVTAGALLAQAAELANKAAGISVMKLGTAVVSPQELMNVTAGVQSNTGVLQLDELLPLVQSARERGETIVMTNGCFDILHWGHLMYLQKAALLGDRLIVAVNDDDSVFRLKGAGRPVKSLSERMSILAALQMIDWVVAFSEDTPLNLITAIQPDVLVKGGDYKAEEVVGYEQVSNANGEVVVLDYIDGYSTSTLIQKIRNQSP